LNKIITRIKGGLGNQLFSYSAARRLALINNVELIIDDVTGFKRDRKYRRSYMLDNFKIPVRKATPTERLEPFERYRRGIMKLLSQRKIFSERHYLQQEGVDFDKRILDLKIRGTLYLDGLWQSEDYFKDVEQTIREDLQFIPPTDEVNKKLSEKIHNCNAVAVHVRWFEGAERETSLYNVSAEYYRQAISKIQQSIYKPHYFLFSDDLVATKFLMNIPEENITYVDHNHRDSNDCFDLWLMTQCRHFITANSTFSWWGAWLGGINTSMIITPALTFKGLTTSWGFDGQIPQKWIRI